MIVLDTAALLFWTLDPARLSSAAGRVIDGADRILVSSISIWEIAIKVRRGRLTLPVTVRDYVGSLSTVRNVEIVPVDQHLWLENVELDWNHRDPADRTVVTLAARNACPLVTSDRAIRARYAAAVW